MQLWETGGCQPHHNNVHSCIMFCVEIFWWNIKSSRWLSPHYSPDLAPCNFWLFPKLISPLKFKRFQTVNEIQENPMRHLLVIRRTLWCPKMPTFKATKASSSCVHCFLHLVTSINVSIFHITWLDIFWTKLIYV